MSESRAEALTRGGLLVKNTGFNLIGQGAPLLAGLVALPLLFQSLGEDRFGILLLLWTVISYSSLFDLGLSRALTKLVADALGDEKGQRVAALTRTALLLMVLIGLLGAVVLAIALPLLVRQDLLNVPPVLRSETVNAFYLLALSVPFIVGTAGLRGMLAAYQRFDLVNAVRIPFGIYNFVAPLCVLPFSKNLVPIVAVLVAGRAMATLVHVHLCLRLLPQLRKHTALDRSVFRPLLHFGTWVSVTTGGATLVIYIERILIGVLLPIAAVGYFATPYDLVTKVMIIPSAVVSVLFPAFAMHLIHDPPRATRLFAKGARYVFILLFPVALVIITLAYEGLTLWMGEDFASEASIPLQWLMAGGFLGALTYMPVTLLHSAGRPDITGKTFLVYFPLYVAVIWWLIPEIGIEGVALAHATRLAIEGAFLFYVAGHYLPGSEAEMKRLAISLAAALVAFIVSAVWPQGLLQKGLALGIQLPIFSLVVWRILLDGKERAEIRHRLSSMRAGT